MENSYLVLGTVVLLFISIYLYTQLAIIGARIKKKRANRKHIEKEALRYMRRIKNQKTIQHKVAEFKRRKEEIRRQWLWLQAFRKNSVHYKQKTI